MRDGQTGHEQLIEALAEHPEIGTKAVIRSSRQASRAPRGLEDVARPRAVQSPRG